MSQEDKSLSGLPISGSIVAIALLLGLGFVSHIPFQPSRPKQPLHVKEAAIMGENIQARLWQDPFEAIARYEKRYPENKLWRRQQIEKMFPKDRLNKGEKIVVLGIMVFGGPYAEEAEMRTRYRYAALSALGRLNYVPIDELHIGRLDNPLEEGVGPRVIPYEWFEPATDQAQKILVLWLNDDRFFPEPLTRLRKLIDKLRKEICQGPCDSNSPELVFKILGPAGSRNLNAMITETCEETPSKDEQEKRVADLEMYSWGATAEFKGDIDRILNDKCPFQKTRLIRTIGTDGALIHALLKELRLRGVDPVPKKTLDSSEWKEPDSIALISEWDTHYGRSLPETFVQKIMEQYENRHKKNTENKTEIEKSQIYWIHPFSYMRGLDGLLPEDVTLRSSTGTTKEKSEKEERKETVERPEGKSQFDYLRRLARQLRELDAQIRRDGRPGIQAIGVLGGDVYDKLLVLQAMYRLFPNVIFFTTDLDARLLHPEELKWTRNLVVASSFGLRLHPRLQKNIPPFRDNYQTSLFFSTLLALSNNSDSLDREKVRRWLGPPRIFEVGKNGAFGLRTHHKFASKNMLIGLPGETVVLEESIHPSPGKEADVMRFFGVVPAGLLFIGICLALYYRSEERKQPRVPWGTVCLVGYPLLVAGVLYGVIMTIQGSGAREPLSFTDGISIWPTEFLRFLIAGLTFYFIISVYRKTTESHEVLKAYFEPKDKSGQKGTVSRIITEKQKRLLTLWSIHKIRSRPKKRWCRVMLLSASYAILCSFIIHSSGPPAVPYRGTASLMVDRVALILCVGLFIVLVFCVVDATRQVVWLIRRLPVKDTDWPQATKKREPEAFRMSQKGLNEWINIHMIVDLTETVNRFVYYPVIILLLLGVSRLRYFDDWHLPVGLLLVMLLGLALSLYCAITLRRASEQSRQKTLDALWVGLLEAKTSKPQQKSLLNKIEMIRTHIRDIRKGALVPFIEQPWVRALAIFLSGGGSLLLLELLP